MSKLFVLLISCSFCQLTWSQNIMLQNFFEEQGYTFENVHQNYYLALNEGVFQSSKNQKKMVYASADMFEFAKKYLKSQEFNFSSTIRFAIKLYFDKNGHLDWLILELFENPDIMSTNEQLELFIEHLKRGLKYYKLSLQATKIFYFYSLIIFD